MMAGAISEPQRGPAILDRLTDPAVPAFALLYRPRSGRRHHIDVFTGRVATAGCLSELPLPDGGASRLPRHDLLAVIPYRQIRERGFACRDDGAPLLALMVTDQEQVTLADAAASLPNSPVTLSDARFDVDDSAYAETVRTVLSHEIGRGAGSNFVIKRTFLATIENFSTATALSIFRRLLSVELGSYWTFVVHTGSRTFVGATPERHISLTGGIASMNPISGTYSYHAGGPKISDVLKFLSDKKEIDELYMVVDEELKMMAQVCERGGRVIGPFLKEMARLAHTEYVIEGRSTLDTREILRKTMFAPPVVGSPLENACRVITRYEASGRGYYSGVLALIGRDTAGARTLDSAIIIRTADVDHAGRMKIGVGATLVRHSNPGSEVAETKSKAAGLLAALDQDRVGETTLPTAGGASKRDWGSLKRGRLSTHPTVRHALEQRNAGLARFWLEPDFSADCFVPEAAGFRVLVIDAEDNFTAMLAHQLRSLGLDVTIRNFDAAGDLESSDLVVIGPGPGDPTDKGDPKIHRVRIITEALVRRRTPLLGLCLGHQVLADVLGFKLVRKRIPNQGVRRKIRLFGRSEILGFYNTFAAFSERDRLECVGVGRIVVSRDERTGEIHAIRGPHFSSFQFHPESVLSERGLQILAAEITALLWPACRRHQPLIAR